jgi:mRNA interferase HigB
LRYGVSQQAKDRAVRVISNRKLLEFSGIHETAAKPLQAWRLAILNGTFSSHAHLKTTFNTVDKAGNFYIFDIGGNKYRVVAAIHFNRQILYVRHVMTHAEYDRWKP